MRGQSKNVLYSKKRKPAFSEKEKERFVGDAKSAKQRNEEKKQLEHFYSLLEVERKFLEDCLQYLEDQSKEKTRKKKLKMQEFKEHCLQYFSTLPNLEHNYLEKRLEEKTGITVDFTAHKGKLSIQLFNQFAKWQMEVAAEQNTTRRKIEAVSY